MGISPKFEVELQTWGRQQELVHNTSGFGKPWLTSQSKTVTSKSPWLPKQWSQRWLWWIHITIRKPQCLLRRKAAKFQKKLLAEHRDKAFSPQNPRGRQSLSGPPDHNLGPCIKHRRWWAKWAKWAKWARWGRWDRWGRWACRWAWARWLLCKALGWCTTISKDSPTTTMSKQAAVLCSIAVSQLFFHECRWKFVNLNLCFPTVSKRFPAFSCCATRQPFHLRWNTVRFLQVPDTYRTLSRLQHSPELRVETCEPLNLVQVCPSPIQTASNSLSGGKLLGFVWEWAVPMNSYFTTEKKLLTIKFGRALFSHPGRWTSVATSAGCHLQPAGQCSWIQHVWPGYESDVGQPDGQPDATNAIWLPADLVWLEISGRVQRACLSKHTRRSRARPTVFYTACADARRELWVQTFGDSVAKGNVISTIAWMTRLLISMETSILRKYELRTKRSSVWTLPWPYVHHMSPEQLMSQFPATRAHCVVVYIFNRQTPWHRIRWFWKKNVFHQLTECFSPRYWKQLKNP